MKEITLNWEEGILIYYSDNKKYRGISSTCLSSFLNDLRDQSDKTCYYEFEFYRGLEYISCSKSLWCPFSDEEILRTLEDIKKVADFTYSLETTEEKVKISFQISKSYPRNYHLYIITRIRYLYEGPYNVIYRDAMTLSELEEFKNINLQDLFNMIVSSIPTYPDNPRRDRRLWYYNYHGIPSIMNSTGCFFKRMDYNEIKSILVDKLRLSPLNSLYGLVNGNCIKLNIDEEIVSSLAYWASEFETRLPVYKFNIKSYNDSKLDENEVHQINREVLLSRILEEDKKIKKPDPYESKNKISQLRQRRSEKLNII